MHSISAVLLALRVSCGLFAASPALTIYNQDFAVIRDVIPINLKSGLNHIEYPGMTASAEPASVILRDPSGKFAWQIVEQNYRKDAASADRMLELYEGKTIQFCATRRTPNAGRKGCVRPHRPRPNPSRTDSAIAI